MGIVMRETSPDFRQGFEFAVKAIHDMIKDRENYTLDLLNQTLSSILTLIENGVWWPDIKKVILHEI